MTEPAAPPLSRSRWPRLRLIAQFGFCLSLFVVGLCGAARVMDRLLPALEVPVIDEKLAYFAQHRDEFDTLFFGSSRTYHQLFPGAFDLATAEAGVPTKTFNFGVDGMFPPEDGFVAERLFALQPKNLKRVFIEISFFRNDWYGIDPDSIRALHWHDSERLGLAWQEAFTPYQSSQLDGSKASSQRPFRWKNWRKEFAKRRTKWGNQFDRWWGGVTQGNGLAGPIAGMVTHLRLYFRHALNSGRGAQWVDAIGFGKTRAYDWNHLGAKSDGAVVPASRKRIAAPPLEEFDRLLVERQNQPEPLRPMSLAQQANTRRIVDLVRSVGAEPILFVSPDVIPCRRYLPIEPNLPYFDFTEIAKWPELFRRENRLDRSHLDREGSLEFTRAFARRYLEYEAAKSVR